MKDPEVSDRWIAHREYVDAEGRLAAHAFLSEPTRDAEGRWGCRVRLHKGEAVSWERAHGVDAVQALTNGLACIRTHIEREALSWVGGEGSGISAALPLALGKAFHDRLVRVVDDATREEFTRFAKERGVSVVEPTAE